MVHDRLTEPVHLTSPENQHVKAVLRLRRQRHRRQDQLLIAEGDRQVTRALTAKLKLRQLFWSPMCADQDVHWRDVLRRSSCPHTMGFTVTPQLMAKMAYRQNPEDVLGVFEQPVWELDQDGASSDPRWSNDLWLVAAGTQKPGNLGAMVRTAEAAGCQGVLVADGVVDAFNPNAIHASTGAVFRLPVVAWSASRVKAFLQRRQVQAMSAVPDATRVYTDVDMRGPTAVIVGPEDVGLSEVWTRADGSANAATLQNHTGVPVVQQKERAWPLSVSIPMFGGATDSLNAATAAAIVLFEAVRQRCSTQTVSNLKLLKDREEEINSDND